MALFSKLPEDPVEWAGLPAEPSHRETAADRLTDSAPVGLDALGVGDLALDGSAAVAVESIVIPVPPVIEIADAQQSGADE